MTARQIHAERESRTLFPLLAKPVQPERIRFSGNSLGCWLACGWRCWCFTLFCGHRRSPAASTGGLLEHFQAFWLHWIMLGVVVAMVLAGSLVFTAPSSNATICFDDHRRHSHARTASWQAGAALSEPPKTVALAAYYTPAASGIL